MAAETEVVICNQQGVAIDRIRPDIQSVAWRLNNESQAKFAMSWKDTKCTTANIRYGNRVAVLFDNGLPTWGGVIEPPLKVTQGTVEFQAYSGERLLNWRVTELNFNESGTPGTIAEEFLAQENASRATGVVAGSFAESGTPRNSTGHYHDLLQRLKDLAHLSGQDFHVRPNFASGVLTFYLDWYESRGDSLVNSLWFNRHNTDISRSFYESQGPLANHIRLTGSGETWGPERMNSHAMDETKEAAYGYREYAEAQVGVTQQATLDANAAALLAERKDPQIIYSLFVTNTKPALFSTYDVGDTGHVDIYPESAEWYRSEDVRILAREWAPADVCRLEVLTA